MLMFIFFMNMRPLWEEPKCLLNNWHLATSWGVTTKEAKTVFCFLTKYTMGFCNHHFLLVSFAASFLISDNAHAQKDRICDSHLVVIYAHVEHFAANS